MNDGCRGGRLDPFLKYQPLRLTDFSVGAGELTARLKVLAIHVQRLLFTRHCCSLGSDAPFVMLAGGGAVRRELKPQVVTVTQTLYRLLVQVLIEVQGLGMEQTEVGCGWYGYVEHDDKSLMA
ncbi:hypothetical protein [Pseudomonas sp. McL0111]|uniref:hypothetical protein n=1 Tax=Pseudomonas sp. McL0111 TaxID=3457357 RepID=UPI00403E806A